MKSLLAVSLVLIVIASFLVFSHPQKAEAVPISYNLTALTVPFTSYTRAGANNFDILVDAGYNGTITSVYQGRTTNNTINWEFGYHPTLPTALDNVYNITASASVAATQSLPITIVSGRNNVAIIVGISFEHTANTDHNKARMSSVAIGANTFSLILNKTVTCGAAACDSEIWVLGNNTALTGAQTITITPSDVTNYHMVAGAYLFFNTRSVRPLELPTSATGTSVTPSVTITPQYTTGQIVDNILYLSTSSPSANSHISKWVGHTSILSGASQKTPGGSDVSGVPVTLSWTIPNVQWISTAVEIIPIQNQINFALNPAFNTHSGGFTQGYFQANASKIYYVGYHTNNALWPYLQAIDTVTGVETHVGQQEHAANCQEGNNIAETIFIQRQSFNMICGSASGNTWTMNSVGGNFTSGGSTPTQNNQIFRYSATNSTWFNGNNTSIPGTRTPSLGCYLTYIPSNTTTAIDNIACDSIIPNHANKWWNGMYIYKIGNYYTNSTLSFLSNIDSQTYKTALTIPATIYNIPNPDVKLLGHWGSPGADYLFSVSSGNINYIGMSYLTTLLNQNRAYQPYDLTLVGTDNHFYISPTSSSPQVSIKLYGPSLNTTLSKYGMLTIPSGYTMRTTSTAESVIRTLDPRWTNTPATDIPAISTASSLFPIVLTVGDAPADGGLWLSNGAQVINSVNSAWCITTLDTTHTAECDIPAGQCANAYVTDISVTPTVWNYEGYVCATGSSAKTIYYTNTTPLTFYSMPYGASSSYTAATNGLTITTRATTTPYTYTVVIKNATGTTTQTFSETINATSATHSFNVTNATKPASVSVSFTGAGVVYTAYMGSSLSLASVSSFFHTYFSYQGFDLLSFIPIIFASMFTRNTVGIGGALTVVLIATLSWLSIVVIPDTTIYIMIFVAVLSLIGYRSLYG